MSYNRRVIYITANGMKWLKGISIKQKLYLVMIIMAMLIIFELVTLLFSVRALSGLRAFIAAEGLWSKAQKDAVYYLHRYSNTHNIDDYLKFREHIRVPLGDRKARVALSKQPADYAAAEKGLMEGRNNIHDIHEMIWLYTRFSDSRIIKNAMSIWQEGEPMLLRLIPLGERLHYEIESSATSEERIANILKDIDQINQQLTILEEKFSGTLADGYRQLESLVLTIIFIVAITVELTGLALTISVTMKISRGVKEIVRVSGEAAKSNLKERAAIQSNDEIGVLAKSFNSMLDELQQLINEQKAAESALKHQNEMLEKFTVQLEENNSELERLAYVTSHHLREPLRAISSFSDLLMSKCDEKLDYDGHEFLNQIQKATRRMDKLTRDLVQYVQVSKSHDSFTSVDTNEIIRSVKQALGVPIRKLNAIITTENLPVIVANKGQIQQLFFNILDNALKFNRGIPPEIHVSCRENTTHWLFSVKDNGIGIDTEYQSKIFGIFQRLKGGDAADGTGIGLTICKKIAEKHGGIIWVESVPGQGSVIYFTVSKNPGSQIFHS